MKENVWVHSNLQQMFVTNFRLNFYPGYSQFAPSFPWAYHPPSLSSFSAYLEDRASGGEQVIGCDTSWSETTWKSYNGLQKHNKFTSYSICNIQMDNIYA